MARIHNFSAGPAVLPLDVIERTRDALLELNGSGLGLIECSHRSKLFDAVIDSAKDRLRRLLALADDQEILFLHGGASTQFFQIPMNLLRGGRATYLDTGVWSNKAIAEAKRFGTVDVPFSSRAQAYDRVPEPGEWGELPAATAYLHYTSNNTVAGTQYAYQPTAGSTSLICDMSSDILSRPVDGAAYDLIYAGAQKNLGPSGTTVVILRRGLLERCDPDLPTMLRYDTHVKEGSMYNTPSTFGIYVVDQTARWVEDQGGLPAIQAANGRRAGALYAEIDRTGYYRALAKPGSRSVMNVTFTTGHEDRDTAFWQEAEDRGMSGLKGHRLVGGLRASLYNAQTDAAVAALVEFMADFERRHG